jgi:peptidoglycan/LPS O-acetylase OafA/YrhL
MRMTSGAASLTSAPSRSGQGAGPRSLGYRSDIDGLRALAVGLVLAFHAFPAYFRGGFIGVDIFFVISGYLITSILMNARNTGDSVAGFVLNFYEHRVRRIFPALILVLVACAAYGWFRLFPTEYEALTKYIAGGAGFVTNFIAWSEAGYFDQSADVKPLLHLWSLAIEEQFYVFWPLLILFIGRLGRRRLFSWVFGALAVASLTYCIFLTSADPTAAYYSPLSRGWELAVGGLLASLHARGFAARTGALSGTVSIVALVSIPLSAVLFIREVDFPGWQALLPVAATAAIIWFGAGTWANRTVLSWRPVVYIGLISYPLYLWHWVLLAFLRIQDPQPPGIVLILTLGASVVLAAATFHFVERPVKQVPLAKASIALVTIMALVLVFGVAANALRLAGVKLTPMQTALSKAYDPEPAYRFHKCFLDSAAQASSDFAAECGKSAGSEKPALLLWGDSLAAQLYPGLLARGGSLGYAIEQRTASSCPPSLDNSYSDRGNCNEINADTRAYIEKSRPTSVIINGRWPEEETARNAQISALSGFLRANGVQSVGLVGPAPDWVPDLRGNLLRTSFPGDQLPEFMTPPAATWPATRELDHSLKKLSDDLGIRYLSLIDKLCTANKCRIRVSGDIPAGLVTSDHDHLTAEASTLVFQSFVLPAATR